MKEDPYNVFVPMKLKKRGGRKMVITPDGHLPDKNNAPDEVLVKALTQAHLWQKQLDAKKYGTVEDIAKVHNLSSRHVRKILKFNFLAPQIKGAILNGTGPKHLRLNDFLNHIPMVWEEQMELFF